MSAAVSASSLARRSLKFCAEEIWEAAMLIVAMIAGVMKWDVMVIVLR